MVWMVSMTAVVSSSSLFPIFCTYVGIFIQSYVKVLVKVLLPIAQSFMLATLKVKPNDDD